MRDGSGILKERPTDVIETARKAPVDEVVHGYITSKWERDYVSLLQHGHYTEELFA